MRIDRNIRIAMGLGILAGALLSIKVGREVYVKTVISDKMFSDSAKLLGIDEAFLRAIAEKEGGGKGFYINGKPIVRLENHILEKYYLSKGKTIDADKLYGSNKSGMSEYSRFVRAYNDDPEAAIYATSFGAFQVMGFNAIPIGYKSLYEFYNKMHQSADNQFEAVVRFIKKNNLTPYIKNRDYNGFAKKYNGSVSYAQGPNGIAALHKKWLSKTT